MHSERAYRVQDLTRLEHQGEWEEIYRRMILWEFPSEARMGFQLAFLVPFAVPRMARTLTAAGGITYSPLRRAYRTGIIIHELIIAGLDSPEACSLIRHMNRAHRNPGITQAEMTFVLNAFIVLPTRWIERAGWRAVTDAERRATVEFYGRLGHMMGITKRPATYKGAEESFDEYAASQIAPSSAGAQLGEALLNVLRGRLPRAARPLAAHMFSAFIDPPQARAALSLPEVSRLLVGLVDAAIEVRRVVLRLLPPPREPAFQSGQPIRRLYPFGYTVEELTQI